MKGSGNTEGGIGLFFLGLSFAISAVYFFFDSIRVTTGRFGWVTSIYAHNLHSGFQTISIGLIFVPFFIGVFLLFYDATLKWAWWIVWG